MKAEHTPTPWFLFGSFIKGPPRMHDGEKPDRVHKTPSSIIARLTGCEHGDYVHYPEKIAQANREFIVRAVNSHEALLEACKLALETLTPARNNEEKAAVLAIQTAIKLAESEVQS